MAKQVFLFLPGDGRKAPNELSGKVTWARSYIRKGVLWIEIGYDIFKEMAALSEQFGFKVRVISPTN